MSIRIYYYLPISLSDSTHVRCGFGVELIHSSEGKFRVLSMKTALNILSKNSDSPYFS